MLSHELIAQYGVLIVFINVFSSSLGLPIPATPTLMMAGAAVALGADGLPSTSVQVAGIVGSAVIGGALADLVWFHGSRRFGDRTLNGVGKLLTPRPAHIRNVERLLGNSDVRVLLFARFVPGLSFLSVLLCSARSVRTRSFMLHDCIGIGIWAAAALTLGALSASPLQDTFETYWPLG